MREEILKVINKNSKLLAKEVADIINADEKTVADEIKKMEEEHIICGYNTLINWEKTQREDMPVWGSKSMLSYVWRFWLYSYIGRKKP